jgi:hypothetical protein
MRDTLEDNGIYDPLIHSGLKLGVKVQSAIAAAVTLNAKDPVLQFLALSTAQNVNMPANVRGLTYIIVNTSGTAVSITIKDSDTTTTRGTIAQNTAAIVSSDGTRWWVLPLT